MAAHAQDISVLELAPITLTLVPDKPGLLYIADRGTAPVMVQIEAYAWSQSGGKDQLSSSDALLISPPMTSIAPGERQVVRVLADDRYNVSGVEKAYRLLISQIPAANASSGQVKVLLQFSLPIFVGDEKALPAAVSWRAQATGEKVVLTAHNAGGRAAKFIGLKITSNDLMPIKSVTKNIAYILPGADYTWHLQVNGVAPAALSISTKDERSGTTVTAEIPVER